MSRLPVFSCLALLGTFGGSAVSEEVNTSQQDEKFDSMGSSSDNALASPDGPNVYAFHVGGWPFSVDFPKPSFLPGYDACKCKNLTPLHH